MDLAAFKAMSGDQKVQYLKEWTPPSNGLPFEPSRAGLGTILGEWVADNPQHASDSLDAFLTNELHPTFLAYILDAFSSVLKTDKAFDVYAVARAIMWACQSTDLRAGEEKRSSREVTWNWVHMSGARFMAESLLLPERLDLRKAVELLDPVLALCFVPSPTEGDEAEFKKNEARYASLALNSPRPVGVEALIRYGRWIKLATPEPDFNSSQLQPVFDLLEQKLDPERDASAAVRNMFGRQFRTLAWLDLEWFVTVIPRLFPGKSNKVLDRVAWHAYMEFGGGPLLSTFPAMRERYRAAIKALQNKEEKVGELDRILAGHVMQFYAHGALELNDPLLVDFFERASGALRAQAIGDIGWDLGREGTPLAQEMQARLMALWESRATALTAGPKKSLDELGVFGWWLASNKFPDEWSVDQAMRVLEGARSLRPDFAVVEAFARLAPRFPYEAARAVRVLFEEDRNGWAIHGWSQYLRKILVQALNSGEKARLEAERMIELLVAKGHREYRDLAPSALNRDEIQPTGAP